MSTLATTGSGEIEGIFRQYVVGNYTRFPICLVRGEGSRIWDAEGNRYLDFFPGWGCNFLGHCPPRVVEAVREQVATLIHVPNSWLTEPQGRLAEALSARTFGGKAFFCNSGAEANEAAIKMARAFGAPSGRFKILSMTKGFHGRTYAALSATAQPKYHQGFEPMVPGFSYVPFNDLDAVREAIDGQTAAVILEPVQGEGGINLPAPGYLEGLRAICDEAGALLILDEVQSGMGRTGAWFAYQHSGIAPDILTCAKALAGGIAAGVTIARAEVADQFKPGMHGCTFGGNPIACRAALAVIEAIEEDDLLARATAVGERFRANLEALRRELPGLIREVRVLGTMIGIELTREALPVVDACLKRRLLINATQGNVIRLLPAGNIEDEQIDEGCAILADVLKSLAA